MFAEAEIRLWQRHAAHDLHQCAASKSRQYGVGIFGAHAAAFDHFKSDSEMTGTGRNQLENKMTNKTEASQQPASAHGCCGSQTSKDKAGLPVAKPEAAVSPEAKRSGKTEAAGSCCHGESSADTDHKTKHTHQS